MAKCGVKFDEKQEVENEFVFVLGHVEVNFHISEDMVIRVISLKQGRGQISKGHWWINISLSHWLQNVSKTWL